MSCNKIMNLLGVLGVFLVFAAVKAEDIDPIDKDLKKNEVEEDFESGTVSKLLGFGSVNKSETGFVIVL